MDDLLSEISKKRKDLADPIGSNHAQKYMRKADLERAREEEERRQKELEEAKKREAKQKEKVSPLSHVFVESRRR